MKNKILYLLIAAGMMVSVSCKKKLDNAYANPNFPIKVSVDTILPTMIANMHRGLAADTRFISRYVQYMCNSAVGNNWDRHGYDAGTDNGGEWWRIHYWNYGYNLIDMINQSREEEKWDFVGVGYAMWAHSWLALTDCSGEVILNDAFKRDNLTFKYDTQDLVYDYVNKLCDTALMFLARTDGKVGQGKLNIADNYFYGGDRAKWIKFVHGVRARMFNHLSNKSTYSADSVIKYTNLAMQSADDDAIIRFVAGASETSGNVYSILRQFGNVTTNRQTTYICDLMNGANASFTGVADPRRITMLRPNNVGAYVGVVPTSGMASVTNTSLTPNVWGSWQTTFPSVDTARYLYRHLSPWPVMTYAEMQFIKAEAAFRKGDKAMALAAYTEGIRGSFDMLINNYNAFNGANAITTATRDAFIANPAVVPANANNLTLSQIMLQKYIALMVWGSLETWTDIRRFHYTDNDAGGNQVYTGLTVPYGNLFPANNNLPVYRLRPRYNSEYIWNLNEVAAIGGTQPDYHTKECWFSKP